MKMDSRTSKNILMVMPDNCSVTVGGMMTICIELANLLSKNSYKITACCFTPYSSDRPKNLLNDIQFINLHSEEKNINDLIGELAPNLIIFIFPSQLVRAKIDSAYDNIPRILMFHSRPDFYFEYDISPKALEKYYKNTIAQVLFPSYYNLLPDFIKTKQVICTPNYSAETGKYIEPEHEHKKIVYLSRVDKLKGQDFLIKSFAIIAKKYPDWSIDIWGQSEPVCYIEKLKKLTKKLKVNTQINFKGITNTPIDTLCEYDFCLFPSYMEGFPVGLIEAQSVGLPAIGLKCCSGVNELITDGENGFLTDMDINEFSKKIELLIKNKKLRIKMSDNARMSAKKYTKNNFDNLWITIVDSILNDIPIQTVQEEVQKYELLPIEGIMKIYKKEENSLLKNIFSIKNTIEKGVKRKVLTIFGLKINLKTIEI